MEHATTRLRVGDLARLAGVSIRTLHHYDDVGLLVASGRTESGYRTYDDAAVDRLRAILAYREMGLSLDEIATAIDDGPLDVLIEARRRLSARLARLGEVAAALDSAIENERRGTIMTPEEKLAVFGDFDPDAYAEEAHARWGSTDAYAESARRTSSYTHDDWQAVSDESTAIYRRFKDLMEAGVRADSDDTRDAVRAHREHISRWFYDCTPEIHKGLGTMYVADERFTANIDKYGDGLAQYMSDAIEAAYG